ncbi:MAG: dTDP-4-amino-4,6-dideoxygalactose transaminase [Bacteroidales bacterium]|nr:dTDP-4-amino-4,6-dideoxygalactose transaminase [Bacteroidales bacterium]MCF8404525.1 dTDP-4-amino-4,6-dideoxygalactose transaminase [Bacteroidales bacterium]
MSIPFNKPYFTGLEAKYLSESALSGKISGNGAFTKKCHDYFENTYGLNKVLLTTSCTDALEMCALLVDIQPGDEVIIPSFTFVSTANAFLLRGAKIVFADSSIENPNIDPAQIEDLITPKTKAIIVVHYAGIACNMDWIMDIALKHKLYVIEDAAHAIDSWYKDKKLGTIGHLAAFSFHETKNIISGEGGMLVINDNNLVDRAEIIWEKGTNRAAFHRGEVDKYGWLDLGSSFLPSELTAAVLFAQLQNLDSIQFTRTKIWNLYFELLKPLESQGKVKLPGLPSFASNNGHMFYLICRNNRERNNLINFLHKNGIQAVFHYLPLHQSPYFHKKHDGRKLPHAINYSDCIVRLPFFFELKNEEIKKVAEKIIEFFE